MSAAYLIGLGRGVDAEGADGEGDSASSSAGVSSSDGRSILLFARGLGAQPADLVRLYERRDHYVAVDRDASTIAYSYFRSSAALKSWWLEEVPHPYLTVNTKMGNEVIRSCLLRQRLRLELYVLDGNKWVLGRRGSPGNIGAFEEECLVNGELPPDASTVIAAVRLGRTGGSKGYSGNARLVGVAFVDAGARAIHTSEFEDDENLCTLESLLCQQGTREVLLHAEMDKGDRKALEQMLDICEDLKRLLGVDDDPASRVHARCFESQQQLPVGCFAALFRYLDLAGAAETHGQWSLDWVEPREFVRLDASALRALSVEPQPSEPDKNASLLGIFSVCKTAGGARLLRTWLKQPLLSAFEINQRLDLVQTFISGFALRSTLRDSCLPPMAADLDRLQRRLFSGKASLQDVVLLYSLLNGLPRLLSVLGGDGYAEGDAGDEGRALVAYVFTEPLRQVESNFERFNALVSAAVDLEAIARHEYLIRPHFDPGLAQLGEQRDQIVEKMDSAHSSLCDRLGLDDARLKLENAAPHGYHFRVSRREEKELRGADVTILATKKDGVCFRDKTLEKLAAKYKELSARYATEQSALVSKVVDTAATFCPVVSELSALLSKLDVLLAFAFVSASAPEPYTRPVLLGPDAPRTLILEGARHPCVERMESAGGGTGSFIKNDVRLHARPSDADGNSPAGPPRHSPAGGSAADASMDTSGDASLAAEAAGEPSLVLVTGPNCGGKSTYIRSVGACVLLAQVGCFVPCDRAVLSPVDAILARVGAGDMQSRGVSTFMAEMLESSTILRAATPASLVIIDELGRGTSTYDGYGIATAICSQLLSRGCLTLFATHFHELTALADQQPGVGNKHVAAHVDGNDLTMLFKVEDGPSDQSYGIAVAAACGFPPSVLENAKRKLAQLEGASRAGADTAGGTDGNTGGGSGELATGKRARVRAVGAEARAEGIEEMKRTVQAFAAAELDAMPEEDQVAAVKRLVASLSESKNEYVAALVEAANAGL